MKILASPGDWWLGPGLRDRLGGAHSVAIIDPDEPLEADERTERLVADVDAIVHCAYPWEGAPGDAAEPRRHPSHSIDTATRRLYNLLRAAADAGTRRCIVVSTLRLLGDYSPYLNVDESWRSLPPADDPALLACHLSEMVAQEVARDRLLAVVTLRLGFPMQQTSATDHDSGGDAMISPTVAIEAVSLAVTADVLQWQVLHVQSETAMPRFATRAASAVLGLS